MTVHIPAASHSHMPLDDCTLICIWNIWEPSRPQKVLTYESEVRQNTENLLFFSFEIH